MAETTDRRGFFRRALTGAAAVGLGGIAGRAGLIPLRMAELVPGEELVTGVSLAEIAPAALPLAAWQGATMRHCPTSKPITPVQAANHQGYIDRATPEQLAHHALHEHLCTIAPAFPQDLEPYGLVEREPADGSFRDDCSCGCKHFIPLDDQLGMDWGVCANPASHRVGLLTFEHQGCAQFEYDPDDDDPGELV